MFLATNPHSVFKQTRSMVSSSADVWKLGRLNHVAVATPDLAAASKFYKDILCAKVSKIL